MKMPALAQTLQETELFDECDEEIGDAIENELSVQWWKTMTNQTPFFVGGQLLSQHVGVVEQVLVGGEQSGKGYVLDGMEGLEKYESFVEQV